SCQITIHRPPAISLSRSADSSPATERSRPTGHRGSMRRMGGEADLKRRTRDLLHVDPTRNWDPLGFRTQRDTPCPAGRAKQLNGRQNVKVSSVPDELDGYRPNG